VLRDALFEAFGLRTGSYDVPCAPEEFQFEGFVDFWVAEHEFSLQVKFHLLLKMSRDSEKTRGFVNVQDDRFWTRRVDREERSLIQSIHQTRSEELALKLEDSIYKAKKVAAKCLRRPRRES